MPKGEKFIVRCPVCDQIAIIVEGGDRDYVIDGWRQATEYEDSIIAIQGCDDRRCPQHRSRYLEAF